MPDPFHSCFPPTENSSESDNPPVKKCQTLSSHYQPHEWACQQCWLISWEHLCTSFLKDIFVTCPKVPPQNYSQSLLDQSMPHKYLELLLLAVSPQAVTSEYFNRRFGRFKVFQGVSRYFKLFQGVSRYLRYRGGDPRVECPSGDWWMVGSSGKQGKAQPSTQYFCPTISKLVFSYFSNFPDFCTGTVPEKSATANQIA